jgi:hypothetical protein
MQIELGAAVGAAAAITADLMNGTQRDLAISDATATGLIFGLGVGGSFVLVLALTIRAARLANRAASAAGRNRIPQSRSGRGRPSRGRSRSRNGGGAGTARGGLRTGPRANVRAKPKTGKSSSARAGAKTGKYDPYPPQPYSVGEPNSHQPYSRVYRPPAPDDQHSRAATNGHSGTNGHHRPPGQVGVPTTPWNPTED